MRFSRGPDQGFRAIGDRLSQAHQRYGSDDAGIGDHAVDDSLQIGVGARHDSAPEVARSGDGPALEDLGHLRQPGSRLSALVLDDLERDEGGDGVTEGGRRCAEPN